MPMTGMATPLVISAASVAGTIKQSSIAAPASISSCVHALMRAAEASSRPCTLKPPRDVTVCG